MRAVAVVLHDVSPSTWNACERLLDLVASVDERIPATLLVVPRYHGAPPFTRDLQFRGAIDSRLSRGDEIALHGYTHVDDGARPDSIRGWFARRVLTAGEAEFATLGANAARERIERGLALFDACGWRPAGFVPPAWQISPAALSCLTEFPVLRYTSTLRFLSSLHPRSSFAIPCLGFSSRTRVRRLMSIAWNRVRCAQVEPAPLLRIALHPADAQHADTASAWRELLRQVMCERVAVTKSALLQSAARLALHQRPMMPRREPIS